MNKFNEMYSQADQKTDAAWANITQDGVYSGHLAATLLVKTPEKFVRPEEKARNKVVYVFDLVNEQGESVHVKTKACTVSFTEKSKLPKIWKKETGNEIRQLLYGDLEDNSTLKALPVKCLVTVVEKDNGFWPTVEKVVSVETKDTPKAGTRLSDWDVSYYGEEPLVIELADGYEYSKKPAADDEEEEELFKRLSK